MRLSFSSWRGNGAVAAMSQGLVVGVVLTATNLVGGIITARCLGPGGRGDLAALLALPTFCSAVFTLGLPTGLIFQVRRDPDRAAGLLAAALLLGLTAGLAGALTAAAATPLTLVQSSPALQDTARWLSATAVLGVVSATGLAALQSLHNFTAFNAVRLSQPLLQLLAIAALAMTGTLTPLSAALATALAGAPGLVGALYWLLKRLRGPRQRLGVSVRQLSSYGLRAFTGELLACLASQVDKVIVVGIFSPAAMGLYVVALNLSRTVGIVSTAVAPVLFPIASGESRDRVLALTARATGVTALLVAAMAIPLVVAGPWILTVIYGREFAAAGSAVRLLVVEAALSTVTQVLSQAFMALNRPGLSSVQYGAGVADAIALLLVLPSRLGLAGAAIALLVAAVIRLAATYWSFAIVLKSGAPPFRRELGYSLATLRAALRGGP